jgi:hypothetical protein
MELEKALKWFEPLFRREVRSSKADPDEELSVQVTFTSSQNGKEIAMSSLRERIKSITNNRRSGRLVLFALFAAILCAPLTANADVVTDWNAIALNTSAAAGNGPAAQARVASIMHAAIFDSVNAIEPRYTVYMVSPTVTLPASSEAAAAAAAHGVLVRLFPAAKPSLDNLYAASLSQIADGDAKRNGIAVGEFVAAEMVALRSNDGSAPQPYTLPPAGLGIWRPTAPTPPISSWWAA